MITCLGSTSAGNCYILHSDTYLILDAGVHISKILQAIDFRLDLVQGVAVTHEHGDHAKSAKEFTKRGIDVWMPYERSERKMGDWNIKALPVKHDVKNHAFFIRHPKMGSILYATDMVSLPYKFDDINHIMIEANFCEDIITQKVLNGSIDPVVRKRIMNTHFSIQKVIAWLKVQDLKKTESITLLHLSNGNSNAASFRDQVERLTGIPVKIA